MKSKLMFLAVIGVSFLTVSCATTTVKRVDTEQVIDFSGRWNDTDSRLTAKTIIEDGLSRLWIDSFREQNGRRPVIIVSDFRNRTDEHINIQVFVKDLERAFLNSGKVNIVASRDERKDLREERVAQNTEGFTDPATIAAMGREKGADFMMIGSINTIKDETGGRYVIVYQVNTELIDLKTNEKVWIGQNLLKKVVKKTKYSL